MDCFYHHHEHAVGICKYCGKGLCHECAADMGCGLACRGSCEDQVLRINKMIDRSQAMVGRMGQPLALASVMFVMVGVFAYWAGDSFESLHLKVLGGLAGFLGLLLLLFARRFTRNLKHDVKVDSSDQ